MTSHRKRETAPTNELETQLTDLIRGRLPGPEAEALRARVRADPMLRLRFDEVFLKAAPDVVGHRRAQHPQAHEPAPELLRALQERGRSQALDNLLSSVVERLGLPLSRGQVIVVAGEGDRDERAALLGEVARRCQAEGLPFRRVHAGIDPFLLPDAEAGGQRLLLDEAPFAPALNDWLLEWQAPLVFTAERQDWGRLAVEVFVSKTYLMPTKGDPGDRPTQVPAHKVLRSMAFQVAWVLGQYGVPIPAPLIARAAQMREDESCRLLETTELFTFSPDGPHGMTVLTPVDERFLGALMPQVVQERSEGEVSLLERILRTATPEEGGTIVALLRRLFLAGQAALVSDLVASHRPVLMQLWNDEPSQAFAWAMLFGQLAEHAVALEILDRAVERSPAHPWLEYGRAKMLTQHGRDQEASATLKALQSRYPSHSAARYLLADLHRRSGRFDEAEAVLQAALGSDPGNLYVLTALAGLACARGDFSGADQLFTDALRVSPGNALLLSKWGQAKARQGEFTEAVDLLKRAIGIDHWNPGYHLALAELYKDRGDLVKAVEYATNALLVEPGYAGARAMVEALEAARGPLQSISMPGQALRKALHFVFRRLQPFAGMAAPDATFTMAASTATEPPQTWEPFEDAETGIRMVATVAARGNLIISVERVGSPLAEATIALAEATGPGEPVEHARRETDANGEVNFGLLGNFPPPRHGGQYQLTIVLPSLSSGGG